MRIIVLLLIIAISHSHIYSSPPKITYTYNGNYCYLKYAMARAGDSNYISGPASDYIYQGNLSFALVTLLEQKQPEIWSEIVVYFHKHYRLMPSWLH